ncbi:DUF3857 domain-containing protein [Tenacibaculum sp. IB213877]|uniref:DUF3857 domain-containing protein n=1 Tax=Tenacibaculum sp. IB213877 TaxID=3097351 RepID=UPI002A59C7B1|nr:DUF3857 domain-containing protein [Tenacibaculum sp. IB213877]MDY0780767.1 DUF3857 domain-containing protein [Tenacibaculum sp. IB213877]
MKKNYPLLLLLFLYSITGFAQKTELAAYLIPDSLTTNANAVLRESLLEINIESFNKQTIKNRKIVTVLNKFGDDQIDLYQHYNNDTKINELSVHVYDGTGNLLKKFSKNKFIDINAVSRGTLYSDARVKYVEYTPTTYPYTVVFESEIENSSTGFIYPWYPIENYSISIQKSTYKVNNFQNLTIRKREKKLENLAINDFSKNGNFHYELKNHPATKYEKYSLPHAELMPSVALALNHFTLKGIEGTGENWKEFGKWMYDKLLLGRNQLPTNTVNEVKELVKNAKNDIEKAKIVYDYVQNRTRYISVQIDIGGWQPISASEVDKMGYGDCKGLTNYTKALLDAIGVESYYTVVYAKNRRDIDKNFSSIQGNHVILNLPNNGDDLWLECTNQTMPFGFLGDFTDDRDVLVVTPEGGVIKRTPAYKDETNIQTTKVDIILDENGNLKANVNRVSKGIQYDNKFGIEGKSDKELKKYYKSQVWDYNNNLEIASIDITNDKENVVFSEKIETTIGEYASITQNEYIFRLNVFNKFSYIPKRYRNRKQPLVVERGFIDVDEFTIKIPKNYTIGFLPQPKEIKSKFGSYKISLEKIDNSTLLYKKRFLLKEGIYPKEEYKNYRKFLKSIVKHENSRIAITKNNNEK